MTATREPFDDYVERHRTAYRPAEIAPRVGVSTRTVIDWLNCGRLRGRKVGGTWLIPKGAVEEMLGTDPVEAPA